jgi:ferrous iron transport protein B
VNAALTEAPAEPTTLVFVGNPNVGKSTLFNGLTGLRQKVANYAGVTVDAREGVVSVDEGEPWRALDLPGTYSLIPRSYDEEIVEQALRGQLEGLPSPDRILVVVDAGNLRRNLFLLSEVLDLGRPVVVALNMVDEARRGGVTVPTEELRKQLGVPVIETVASSGEGLDELRAALAGPASHAKEDGLWSFADEAVQARFEAATGDSRWDRAAALRREDEALKGLEAQARYAWITSLLQGQETAVDRERDQKIDRLLLHPVAGPLIFLLVMALVFQLIFTGASPLMDLVEAGFGAASEWLNAVLPGVIGAGATSLVTDGVIAGVGAVVVFLPQILILFFAIGFLEDSGYMARAAFLVDRPLRAAGLSGRSFIPLLSGFACAIPGILATRTIPNRLERLLAVAILPLMTCSARLPVYALLIAAFIPATYLAGVFSLQALVLFGLYLVGLAAGLVFTFIVERSQRKKQRGRALPLVVELPPYRRPALSGLLLKLRLRGGDFLRRAGTVVFLVSIVLWFLLNFPAVKAPADVVAQGPAAVKSHAISNSYGGRLGHAIEPAIKPLGYDWKIGIGIIASFAAREVFVSTMGVVYSLEEEQAEGLDDDTKPLEAALKREKDSRGTPVFSLATVCSLLIFYAFALQCGATVAVVKRETSWKFALGQLFLLLALAYVGAFLTYQIMSALGFG